MRRANSKVLVEESRFFLSPLIENDNDLIEDTEESKSNEELNPFNYLSSYYIKEEKEKDDKEKNHILQEEEDIKREEKVKESKNLEQKKENEEPAKNSKDDPIKRKRGRPKKKKEEKKPKVWPRKKCPFCSKLFNEKYIKIHIASIHPKMNSKNLGEAEKLRNNFVEKSFDYISNINYCSKTSYQLLSDNNKDQDYSDLEWFINFQRTISRLGKLHITLINDHKDGAENPLKLNEGEDMELLNLENDQKK